MIILSNNEYESLDRYLYLYLTFRPITSRILTHKTFFFFANESNSSRDDRTAKQEPQKVLFFDSKKGQMAKTFYFWVPKFFCASEMMDRSIDIYIYGRSNIAVRRQNLFSKMALEEKSPATPNIVQIILNLPLLIIRSS